MADLRLYVDTQPTKTCIISDLFEKQRSSYSTWLNLGTGTRAATLFRPEAIVEFLGCSVL